MATTDKSALDEALDQVEHADERTVRVALDLIRNLQCAGLSEQAVGEVLEQRYADQRWSEHIGPFLRSRDVARLLGLTRQAVAKRRDLLAIRTGPRPARVPRLAVPWPPPGGRVRRAHAAARRGRQADHARILVRVPAS